MSVIVRLGGMGNSLNVKQIEGLTAITGMSEPGRIICNWTLPDDENYIGALIKYKVGSYPESIEDGMIAYDSDSVTRDTNSTCTIDGLTDGTEYYIRAFAFTVKGAKRIYNKSNTAGSRTSAIPYQVQGQIIVTSSGPVALPYGVDTIDVFAVGGGGGAGCGNSGSSGPTSTNGNGGGGGGYTTTKMGIKVALGATLQAVIGAGGTGGTGGPYVATTPGGETALFVNGEEIIKAAGGGNTNNWPGGSGGSGGGTAYMGAGSSGTAVYRGGHGGSDGMNGEQAWNETQNRPLQSANAGGAGSGKTTRAFTEPSGTKYSGGGGAGGSYHSNPEDSWLCYPGSGMDGGGSGGGYYGGNGANATPNTGGGGGGGAPHGYRNDTGAKPIWYRGGNGGSGVLIIRWG